MEGNNKYLNWLLLFILSISSSYAQVNFKATCDVRQVVSGAIFNIEYKLENAQGSNYKPPVFRGFNVVSGPSISQSTTIINGRRSSYTAYSYIIMADDPGNYVIPSAIIYVGGKEYRSNMLHVQVIKAAPKKEGEISEMFVKVELDTNQFYVGQQIIVSLKLYTKVSIMNYDVRFDPDLKDMSKTLISTHRPVQQSEVYEGVQYATYVLRKMAFYPQRTGHYEIPRAFVTLGIKTGNRRRTSFFFDSPDKQINVNTDPIPIDVVELPEDAPNTFNGAIGHYSSRYRINKSKLTTDDAFSLILDIQGDGDIKIMEAPILKFDGGLEVYEPKLKMEQVYDKFKKIRYKKQYEYLVTPTKTGNFRINPNFSYFNPDSSKYFTKGIDTFDIEVTQGNRTGLKGSAIDPNKALDLKDILHIEPVDKPSQLFQNKIWYWVLFCLPWIGLIIVWYIYNKRVKEENLDPLIKKRKYALMLSKKHLVEAHNIMGNNNSAFFKAIQSGVLGYLADKLDLQTTDLSKINIKMVLSNHYVDNSLIEDTMQLMAACDMALYAGSVSEDEQRLYDNATNLMINFEEKLNEMKT